MGRRLEVKGAEAVVRRGTWGTHGGGTHSAKGPHSASTLACQLARHRGQGCCLPLLQQGHCSVEAGLLQEAGKVSRNLSISKGHHLLAGVDGQYVHRKRHPNT